MDNLSQALRISFGPALVAFSILLAAMLASGMSPATFGAAVMGDSVAMRGAISLFILTMIMLSFAFSWIATAWHRFILLNEPASLFPKFDFRRILRYLVITVVLWLFSIVAALPITFFIVGFLAPAISNGVLALRSFVSESAIILVAALATWAAFRFSLCLPATAINQPMGPKTSWRATRPMALAIFWSVLILIIANFLIGVFARPMIAFSPILGALFYLVAIWFTTMFGISLLTTLYGHLIKGRTLET